MFKRFFNSSQFQKHAIGAKFEAESDKYKLESFLYPKLAEFTLKNIYEMLTHQFYATQKPDSGNFEPLLTHLLAFVDKLLDSKHGLQGFCNFYADKHIDHSLDVEQLLNSSTVSQLDRLGSKFLVLLLTTFKSSSRPYFIQMIGIVNKLLRISYQMNRAASKRSQDLSSNSSSLISSVTSTTGVPSEQIFYNQIFITLNCIF